MSSIEFYHNTNNLLPQQKYSEIIDFIIDNKEKLDAPAITLETLQGLYALKTVSKSLQRESMVNQVYTYSRMCIHAGDNEYTIVLFNKLVASVIKDTESAYDQACTDQKKICLFNYGLSNGGCFEARIEELLDYIKESNTLYGLLKYEIMEFNKSRQQSKYNGIYLEELIDLLKENGFLEKHNIHEDELKKNPVIDQLRATHLILSDEHKSVFNRISEAFSIYENFKTGRNNLIAHIVENANLTDEEQNNIDALIDEYFRRNPDQLEWV